MRWVLAVATAVLGAALVLGLVGGAGVPATRAQETGTIAGWVYFGAPPYAYGVGVAPAGAPAGQPPERGEVDEQGELPPPPAPPAGVQPAPVAPDCVGCPRPVYPTWPVPVEGALVAIQGTALSATTDEDGWFMIEGVPLGVYHVVAATIPRGARLVAVGEDGPAARPAPYARGAVALRANVIVHTSQKPLNIGALFVGRVTYPPIYQPVPAAPGPGQTEEGAPPG